MRRIRVMGLSIVAVFALSVIVAAAAQASLPEFSANAVGKEFIVTTGPMKFETTGKRTVNCSSGMGRGTITGAKVTKKTVLTLKGCKLAGPFGSEVPCKSLVGAEGEIRTNALIGTLVYLSEPKKEVGLVYTPEGTELFAEFKCESLFVKETVKVRGVVIGQITTVDFIQSRQNFKHEQSAGKQKWREYEVSGEKIKPAPFEMKGEGSESFGYEETGLVDASTLELVGGEAWEIKG